MYFQLAVAGCKFCCSYYCWLFCFLFFSPIFIRISRRIFSTCAKHRHRTCRIGISSFCTADTFSRSLSILRQYHRHYTIIYWSTKTIHRCLQQIFILDASEYYQTKSCFCHTTKPTFAKWFKCYILFMDRLGFGTLFVSRLFTKRPITVRMHESLDWCSACVRRKSNLFLFHFVPSGCHRIKWCVSNLCWILQIHSQFMTFLHFSNFFFRFL